MQRQVKLKHKSHSKAFSLVRAGDSLNPGVYTRDGALADAGALASLEKLIHSIAESGNREALKKALYLYLYLRGVPCE